MRITIIAPENVFELEVDPSMELQDVLALIEAETGTPTNNIALSTDSGTPLTAGNKSLESYGLQGDSVTIFMTFKNLPPSASGSSSSAGPSSHGGPVGFPSNDADLERMRLQALGNPEIMAELRRNDPEIADAIAAGLPRFREAFLRQQMRMQDVGLEKQRQIAALNADPYDIEAQKKIEEAIRLEAVDENMQHAMEYSPESFGNVTMLYINVEVNGHAVKAFVDSGAQTTIISPECAEACGIMRLLDPRFAGMALGVGTARILGRIHSAQIKLGELHLPCAFSVLEGKSVDLLFGLDMLKRHQCCIDLSTNTLRINTTEIPFLAEHELPAKARRMEEAELASDMNQAAGDGINPVASPQTGKTEFPGTGQSLGASSTASSSAGPSAAGGRTLGGNPPSGNRTGGSVASEADISVLVNLGVSRSQAEQLLEAAGGNVDVAASMLFG